MQRVTEIVPGLLQKAKRQLLLACLRGKGRGQGRQINRGFRQKRGAKQILGCGYCVTKGLPAAEALRKTITDQLFG